MAGLRVLPAGSMDQLILLTPIRTISPSSSLLAYFLFIYLHSVHPGYGYGGGYWAGGGGGGGFYQDNDLTVVNNYNVVQNVDTTMTNDFGGFDDGGGGGYDDAGFDGGFDF